MTTITEARATTMHFESMTKKNKLNIWFVLFLFWITLNELNELNECEWVFCKLDLAYFVILFVNFL